MCSCSKDYYNTKQTEYHEGVEEIEQEILSRYGEYIKFSEPREDGRFDGVEWDVIYLRSYIHNEKKTSEIDPYQIAEDVREIIEGYLDTNEVLAGRLIEINFMSPSRKRYTTGEPTASSIGFVRNFVIASDERYSDFVCVEYSECQDLVETILDKEGLLEIYMFESSMDDIMRVVDAFPDIEIVHVSRYDPEEELVAQLTELYPDITFI